MIRKTISMPDAMGDWISDRVKSGQYNNESEYIRDLVRQDQEERSKMAFLTQALAEAEADISAGRVISLESPKDVDDYFQNRIDKLNRSHAQN